MKVKHFNCRCRYIPEQEVTCTTADSDYDGVKGMPKKEKIKIIDYDNPEDVEYLKKYNEEMSKTCPNYEPYPLTKEEYQQRMHEKAIESSGGIENLNWAKVLVGEMTLEEAEEDIKNYYKNKEKRQ